MNKQQKPAIASILFNPFTVRADAENAAEPSTDDPTDEEIEESQVCYIRTKRSARVRRAMFDNE